MIYPNPGLQGSIRFEKGEGREGNDPVQLSFAQYSKR